MENKCSYYRIERSCRCFDSSFGTISGAVQGFFLTIFEMYIFVDVLKLPLENIISLELATMFILAIIVTPIILGFLSYIPQKYGNLIFYGLEIVLCILFLIFTPIEVFTIFALVSMTSILVSYFAGYDFVWYRVLKLS